MCVHLPGCSVAAEIGVLSGGGREGRTSFSSCCCISSSFLPHFLLNWRGWKKKREGVGLEFNEVVVQQKIDRRKTNKL